MARSWKTCRAVCTTLSGLPRHARACHPFGRSNRAPPLSHSKALSIPRVLVARSSPRLRSHRSIKPTRCSTCRRTLSSTNSVHTGPFGWKTQTKIDLSELNGSGAGTTQRLGPNQMGPSTPQDTRAWYKDGAPTTRECTREPPSLWARIRSNYAASLQRPWLGQISQDPTGCARCNLKKYPDGTTIEGEPIGPQLDDEPWTTKELEEMQALGAWGIRACLPPQFPNQKLLGRRCTLCCVMPQRTQRLSGSLQPFWGANRPSPWIQSSSQQWVNAVNSGASRRLIPPKDHEGSDTHVRESSLGLGWLYAGSLETLAGWLGNGAPLGYSQPISGSSQKFRDPHGKKRLPRTLARQLDGWITLLQMKGRGTWRLW